MLSIEGLCAYYGDLEVLNNVSLTLKQGQIVSIIGANGAGKSSFLKCISGLISKKTGRVIFEGNSITNFSANSIVKKGISHVLEGRQLFNHLDVIDNLNLGAYLFFKRGNSGLISQRRDEVFDLFPILKERSRQIAGTLSGGEQQMLAIGRAIMSTPKLLLLDEPSLGLAPLIVSNIFSIIENLNQKGTTILLVEQNANLALGISDFSYVFESGRIKLQGTGQELLGNEDVKKAYLGH
ncbi:MAG: ABC transporter ATP-binding protein [Deltaproteobacteria bacterium]|nr:ABC transporter ATP-binding protein [Deltaproteobacteria bacterium]